MKTTLLSLILLAGASQAGATLVDRGSTTLDTATGLEWLDIYATYPLTYEDLAGGAGGWYAAGFRYATEAEVLTFWQNAGFSPGIWAFQPEAQNVIAYLSLTSFINSTVEEIGGVYSLQFGNYAPKTGTDRPWAGILADSADPDSSDPDVAVVTLPTVPLSFKPLVPRKGNFLVREKVPEGGSTMLLVSISMAALGLISVNRRAQRRC